MKVPVKIIVKENKSFEIEVGTPPVSQLIMKELSLEKGSGVPNKEKVGNLAVEQAIKIAKMKQSSMFINSLRAGVKSVAGSANAMGLLIEGKTSHDFNADLESGKFDNEINSGKTELAGEKKQLLQEQLETFQQEMKKELERLKALEEAEKAREEAVKEAVAEEEKAEEEKPKEKEEAKKPEEEKKEVKEEKETKGKEREGKK